jgi:hypothetical protein
MYFIQHGFICRPSDSTVLEDAGIVKSDALTTRLNLIHSSTKSYHKSTCTYYFSPSSAETAFSILYFLILAIYDILSLYAVFPA